MEIPLTILRNWKKYMDHGDLTLIEKESGISSTTLSIAFNKRTASKETIEAIKKFVEQKKQVLK
jgi:hypothetical protein